MTIDEALAHIGGAANLVSTEGQGMIKDATRDYIWQYPDKRAWCTACGAEVTQPCGGFKLRHNTWTTCPHCGKGVLFLHEARGHKALYDQFVFYEWRRSVVDPEGIVLTASHIWRNSGKERPERAGLNVEPVKIYIFQPGKAVTVYKYCGYGWTKIKSVAPLHTEWGFGGIDLVQSFGQFVAALEGTRIGEIFFAANCSVGDVGRLELNAIANCARRPYLEYLVKCGQPKLAGELMQLGYVPRQIVLKPRAKRPADLLGLSEGQWFEIRRDGIELTVGMLERLNALRRMGLKLSMREASLLKPDNYTMERIAPSVRTPGPGASDWSLTIGDILLAAHVPDKLRRKAYRRILADCTRVHEWHDYFLALRDLGEDMTNTALLLPRDMPAMHDRMTERARLLRESNKGAILENRYKDFAARREKLRAKYTFNAAGLILRPYDNAAEVIEEGKALGICIGSYAERYLAGRTIICCLRRAEEPDVPWRAVEFSVTTGKMVQDRGYRNDWASRPGDPVTLTEGVKKQLRNFWNAWEVAHA